MLRETEKLLKPTEKPIDRMSDDSFAIDAPEPAEFALYMELERPMGQPYEPRISDFEMLDIPKKDRGLDRGAIMVKLQL